MPILCTPGRKSRTYIIAPPSAVTVTASIKNCVRMSLCRAPIAFQMPISFVRSVTDTSMIFMTTMPPTTSDTAATRLSRYKCSRLPSRKDSKHILCFESKAFIVWIINRVTTSVAHDRSDLVFCSSIWSASATCENDQGTPSAIFFLIC